MSLLGMIKVDTSYNVKSVSVADSDVDTFLECIPVFFLQSSGYDSRICQIF